MKVIELIQHLKQMPPNAEVWHLWDGELRTKIEYVWLARGGQVATADHGQVCYSTDSRPEDSPTDKEDRYWHTPEAPEEEDFTS